MALWFAEQASPAHRLEWKVRRVLFDQASPYQHIQVLETEAFGPSLVLDGIMQTTQGDEFIYHEMLTWVPLSVHPHPRRVLIIGGGDGGTCREVVRWPQVEQVVMVEIDRQVVEAATRFLPAHVTGLRDPRVEIRYEDGRAFLAQAPAASFDLVLVDSTDPEGGPGQVLYTDAFRADILRVLDADGIYVQQTGAPFYNPEVVQEVSADVAVRFPVAGVYWTTVPTYPGGLFTFTAGSKGPDLRRPQHPVPAGARWYTPRVHEAAFALPPLLADLVPAAVRERQA
ncbi:Polyamine aminopropyltransferase [Candidatus Hydrogenisulfobacillus filiaventi]|uniref:Polyamine aminopropyltransferase n=1 Tax=Candidatus Hydrogenisulfobacillus filiaventi TaxID=2707344 RepID=A0A6F8ZDG0_9FIRM|nr:Polyamine aminopropyltransferase [Candidatus Hydrogenisulfobacillus filiaventi]